MGSPGYYRLDSDLSKINEASLRFPADPSRRHFRDFTLQRPFSRTKR